MKLFKLLLVPFITISNPIILDLKEEILIVLIIFGFSLSVLGSNFKSSALSSALNSSTLNALKDSISSPFKVKKIKKEKKGKKET
jgi:hypothetical protein